MNFEEILKESFRIASIIIEVFGGLIIVLATLRAIINYFARFFINIYEIKNLDIIRVKLGKSLSLGLEFLIAADILITLVSPTLKEIAVLASIVGIRSVLNLFLEREIAVLSKGINKIQA